MSKPRLVLGQFLVMLMGMSLGCGIEPGTGAVAGGAVGPVSCGEPVVSIANRNCFVAANCPNADELCVLGVCTAKITCASDNQCLGFGLVCNKVLGFCVECALNGDCGGQNRCVSSRCVKSACSCDSSKDCKNSTICSSKNSWKCVECDQDADCTDGRFCVDSFCFKAVCSPNTRKCSGSYTFQVCEPDGLSWKDGYCSGAKKCEAGYCWTIQ